MAKSPSHKKKIPDTEKIFSWLLVYCPGLELGFDMKIRAWPSLDSWPGYLQRWKVNASIVGPRQKPSLTSAAGVMYLCTGEINCCTVNTSSPVRSAQAGLLNMGIATGDHCSDTKLTLDLSLRCLSHGLLKVALSDPDLFIAWQPVAEPAPMTHSGTVLLSHVEQWQVRVT